MSKSILRGEVFGLTQESTMVGEGPTLRRRRVRESSKMRRCVMEAHAMLSDVRAGDPYAALRVREALSTSDLFRSATGEVLDREMLRQYDDMETQWSKFSTRTTVRNFKPKKLIDLMGSRNSLARVPEHTNYPQSDYSFSENELSVDKFGEQFGYTFEARINDDLGELDTIPNSWAIKARYTEDDVSLAMLADPLTGAPNTDFWNAGNGNLGSGLLTADNLQTAITTVSTKRDEKGRIRRPGQLHLVVGPALQFTAERVLNTSEIEYTDGTERYRVPNPFRGKISLTVMENLPGVAWFVMPVPSAPRPAFYTAFLTGFETPDVRYKANQGKAMGGGDLPADAGSFDDDTVYWRVRHIAGAGHGDPLFTWASDGTA